MLSGAVTSGANTVPDVVGPFDLRKGHMVWDGATNQGRYFGEDLVVVPDPQCNLANKTDTMGFNLAANVNCGLQAVARIVPAGTPGSTVIDGQNVQIVLQNPLPGRQGTLGQNTMEGLGFDPIRWEPWQDVQDFGKQIAPDTCGRHERPESSNTRIADIQHQQRQFRPVYDQDGRAGLPGTAAVYFLSWPLWRQNKSLEGSAARPPPRPKIRRVVRYTDLSRR